MARIRHPRQAVSFDEASKIGLLYDATDESNYEIIRNYVKHLRSFHKEILALGYVDRKKLPANQFSQYGLDFFTRKNLNFRLMPNHPIVTNFINEKFDVLINLSSNKIFPLRYIAAVSHAKFRVGRFDRKYTNCYDLMINSKPDTDIKEFISDAENFLRKINSK